jgi:hypothetical protein
LYGVGQRADDAALPAVVHELRLEVVGGAGAVVVEAVARLDPWLAEHGVAGEAVARRRCR